MTREHTSEIYVRQCDAWRASDSVEKPFSMRPLAPWAVTFALTLFVPSAVVAQAPTPSSGSFLFSASASPTAPMTLMAAVTRTPATSGWRIEVLADGRVAAIGVDSAEGIVRVIGIACGESKRPEIAANVRGSAAFPRALLVEWEDTTAAFAIDPAGAIPSGVDVLVSDLIFTDDRSVKMWLDDYPFATNGARQALSRVGKDCEQRFGWQYGNDDEHQLVWELSDNAGYSTRLTFGKPWTGWLLVELTCDKDKNALLVKPTNVPPGTKTGQPVPLAIQIGDQEYSFASRAELFNAGDIAGFLIARVDQPRALLDAFQHAKEVIFRANSEALTVSARGLAPLVRRFQTACGF